MSQSVLRLNCWLVDDVREFNSRHGQEIVLFSETYTLVLGIDVPFKRYRGRTQGVLLIAHFHLVPKRMLGVVPPLLMIRV